MSRDQVTLQAKANANIERNPANIERNPAIFRSQAQQSFGYRTTTEVRREKCQCERKPWPLNIDSCKNNRNAPGLSVSVTTPFDLDLSSVSFSNFSEEENDK